MNIYSLNKAFYPPKMIIKALLSFLEGKMLKIYPKKKTTKKQVRAGDGEMQISLTLSHGLIVLLATVQGI